MLPGYELRKSLLVYRGTVACGLKLTVFGPTFLYPELREIVARILRDRGLWLPMMTCCGLNRPIRAH